MDGRQTVNLLLWRVGSIPATGIRVRESVV